MSASSMRPLCLPWPLSPPCTADILSASWSTNVAPCLTLLGAGSKCCSLLQHFLRRRYSAVSRLPGSATSPEAQHPSTALFKTAQHSQNDVTLFAPILY